jgi:hypothetical protein
MQFFGQVNRDEHDDHAAEAVDQIDEGQKPNRSGDASVRTAPMLVKSEKHKKVFIRLGNDNRKFREFAWGAGVFSTNQTTGVFSLKFAERKTDSEGKLVSKQA